MDGVVLYWLSDLFLGIFLAMKWTKQDDFDEFEVFGKWILCLIFAWPVLIIATIKLVFVNDWK